VPSLSRYVDFIERINQLGFMPMGTILTGLPSLSAETADSQWHTGDNETDPWRWKDRVAEEKSAAYGCILGGHKGFIAPRLYGLFYTACQTPADLADRWEAGEINQTTWQLWQLFGNSPLLDTGQIRKKMGIVAGRGANSRVDTSLRDLQRDFFITVAGSRRKIGRDGQPYGWPANTYMPVQTWAPREWLAPGEGVDRISAREMILEVGEKNGHEVVRKDLMKILGW
jgi:hypothetical protein